MAYATLYYSCSIGFFCTINFSNYIIMHALRSLRPLPSSAEERKLPASPEERDGGLLNKNIKSNLRSVKLTLTAETQGEHILCGYNHKEHRLDGPTDDRYKVPLYKLIVEGKEEDKNGLLVDVVRNYFVIRFGVKQMRGGEPELHSVKAGTYIIRTWKSDYLTDVDRQGNRVPKPGITPGAWVIKGAYYIHDGENSSTNGWGAIGCIELVGVVKGADKFENFNFLIRKLAGAKYNKDVNDTNSTIAKAGVITLIVQDAKSPPLKIIPPLKK
jgi:hypothetical protein